MVIALMYNVAKAYLLRSRPPKKKKECAIRALREAPSRTNRGTLPQRQDRLHLTFTSELCRICRMVLGNKIIKFPIFFCFFARGMRC